MPGRAVRGSLSGVALDAASYAALWQLYDATGVRPEWLLPVLYTESGLNPAIPNQAGYAYYGINQISGTWLAARGIAVADYLTWPASEQIARVVAPYVAEQIGSFGALQSGARVYLANFYPAALATAHTLTAQIVCAPAGGCPPAGTKTASAYCANAGLDADRSGCITLGDLAAFMGKAAKASSVRAAIAACYALRPWEGPESDPALGYDFGPKPEPLNAPAQSTGLRVFEVVVMASAVASLVTAWPKLRAAVG